MRYPKLLMAALSLCGCSSIDADVRPRIVQATMTLESSEPAGLADFDWSVGFDTDFFAERDVHLTQVAIIGDYQSEPFVHTLALDFPIDFDGKVDGDDPAPLQLVNQGVTNGELAFLCEQEVDRDLAAFVQIEYADGDTIYSPFSVSSYEVHCR